MINAFQFGSAHELGAAIANRPRKIDSRPMQTLHPSILGAIYGVSEICLGLMRRSGAGTQSRDRGSLALLWVVIGVAIFFSISIASSSPRGLLPNRHAFYVLGTILFVGGIILRWYSIWKLGRYFTVDVAIAKEHRVIDSGPYRFIRHPSYTGALIAFIGFGLCLGNWLSILLLTVPITAAFLWRIRIEEGALLEALGEDYRTYMQRTKRLIPWIY